jgi:hypothetical protein
MANNENPANKLAYMRRQKAYAWAKYYEQVRIALRNAHEQYARFIVIGSAPQEEAIPEHIKTELKEMAAALKKTWECPVCLVMIEDGLLEIANCGHYYCKPCLVELKSAQEGEPKWPNGRVRCASENTDLATRTNR